jgi:uncharacterized membrane protein
VTDKLRFYWNRLGEQLWIKPLCIGLLSIAAVFLAKMADQWWHSNLIPAISSDSITTLLTIMSSSMLVIAVFAVGSMLAAYESASNTATPRTFSLIIADDVSQNALSTFVGAFIFSIVALVALMNGYFDKPGLFALFTITLMVFAIVVLSFLRWVDCIARLGRMGTTIDKVECAVEQTMCRRRQAPALGGCIATGKKNGVAVYTDQIGYIQRIDVAALQQMAERENLQIEVALLPGNFTLPGDPLAYVSSDKPAADQLDLPAIAQAFVINKERTFDEDPRFGLIVLSEIASRALSPAVNDPGTAISIIGSLVRLLAPWGEEPKVVVKPVFDRVAVPTLSMQDLFDDAFNGIARDGAGSIEVAIRLQKALAALATLGDEGLASAANTSAELAMSHAETTLSLKSELALLRSVCSL